MTQPAEQVDPRVHVCARCGAPNAGCQQAGQWFCWATCRPADWAPPITASEEL